MFNAKTSLVLAVALLGMAGCANNDKTQERTASASVDFVDALLGSQPPGDPWVMPKPASSRYKPGTVFLVVPVDGGVRRQLRGTIWELCAPGTTMADWVQLDNVPAYAGKTGFDKSGLNLAASVPGFAASAELAKSRYTEIKATKVYEVEVVGAKITQRMEADPAFRACMTSLTGDSRAYMVQQGLALGSAEFSFIGDAGAKIEVPEFEVAKVAKAGGGMTITYEDNGTFTFETDDPEKNPDKLLMAAFRNVIKAEDGLVLSGGGNEDFAKLLETAEEE